MLAFAVAVALLTNTPSPDKCVAGSEFSPRLCPLVLPRIVSIAVNPTAPDALDASPQCNAFKLTPALVKHYFRRAKLTDEGSADGTLIEAGCKATGQVRFADGRDAMWSISQLGVGRLFFASSERMVMYCGTCRKPFEPQ